MLRIGVDVGGIVAAIERLLRQSALPPASTGVVMIGTTHFTNAFVESRHLCRVGVLRLGAPATLAIRPLIDMLLANGIDVPVIDPIPLAVHVAEGLVRTRLSHSKRTYPAPYRKIIQGYDFPELAADSAR